MDRKSNGLRILKRFVSCRSASTARDHLLPSAAQVSEGLGSLRKLYKSRHKPAEQLCRTVSNSVLFKCVLHLSPYSQDLRELKLYGNKITVIEGLQRWDTDPSFP